MPDYRHILLERSPVERIARLTLNRPERRNALKDLMQDELGDAIESVAADDSTRVLMLAAAGQTFCAGGDLAALKDGSEPGSWVSDSADDVRRSFKRTQRFMLALQRMEKPAIAIRLSKLMLYKGLKMDLETAMQMAAAAETITLTSRDHAEGAAAIREGRTPQFEGR
ncbi:MAG: enoyl-CoA hydratase/isomerase family protein [Dehalococcoidia bacterium]|nr:enoyl-CoA hydratase/isomerase family protein [Dehalococcoidia bacterium]